MRHALLALLLALLAGCASTQPARYYLLNAIPPETAPSPLASEPVIGVGPVEVASYLNGGRLVRRASMNELAVAEYERWSEPLPDGIARVLAGNLASRVPSAQVQVFPWRRDTPVELRLLVSVLRFEPDPAGQVQLAARWSLLDGDGQRLQPDRNFEHAVNLQGTDPTAQVAAQSEAIAALADEIAAVIRARAPRP
jgi:uncharacterized lipoprotein YmbA